MKTFLTYLVLSLLLCITFVASGCAGLIASGPTAAAIDQDAVKMAAPAESNAALAMDYDANRFLFYYCTATVNPYVYAFDRSKTILCTAAIYADLYQKSDRAGEHDARIHAAMTQPSVVTPAEPALWRKDHAAWMAVIKREKDGD